MYFMGELECGMIEIVEALLEEMIIFLALYAEGVVIDILLYF